MKPLKLEMSAFGSYAGLVEVDFTKAGSGLFLITGVHKAGGRRPVSDHRRYRSRKDDDF